MNYVETVEYIKSFGWMGSRPGLERISRIMDLLGNPQARMKFIHVAGTNGKGSFCVMIESILRAAGYRTGLYVSPCFSRFNECIKINGKEIPDDEFAEITTHVREHAKTLSEKLTEFELMTAIAFEYFERQRCDIVIIEVGMGGRLDATNIITDPALSVITGIALDHTAYLGDTIEKIAYEKAGIIKSGCPVLWAGSKATAGRIIAARAAALGSDYFEVDYSRLNNIRPTLEGADFNFGEHRDLHINLLGLYQPKNAAAVLSAISVLRAGGFDIPETTLREGLAQTTWKARFELLMREPMVIYDGAHNPEALKTVIHSIKMLLGTRVNILSGVMADKDYHTMAGMLSEIACCAFTVTPKSARSLPAAQYAKVMRESGIETFSYETLADGVAAAHAYSREKGIPLVILGSFYMYADVRAALGL